MGLEGMTQPTALALKRRRVRTGDLAAALHHRAAREGREGQKNPDWDSVPLTHWLWIDLINK